MEIAIPLGVLVACTVLGGAITNNKGRGWGIGIVLGLLLSVIGLIIALLLSDKREAAQAAEAIAAARQQAAMYRECPHCKEQMRRDASVCPHCRSESKPWTLHDGRWWSQTAEGNWHYLDETASQWRPFEASAAPTAD